MKYWLTFYTRPNLKFSWYITKRFISIYAFGIGFQFLSYKSREIEKICG